MNVRHLSQVILTSIVLVATPPVQADTAAKAVSDAVQSARTKLFELFDTNTTAVKFPAKSATLAPSERQNLVALVDALRRGGTIKRAVVASWSDQEYPATKGEELGRPERALADARTAAVVAALTKLGITTIESHSMAQQPTWLAKTFNAQDAKVKGAGTTEDAADQQAADLGKLLRKKGGPGSAVVVIERVGDVPAH